MTFSSILNRRSQNSRKPKVLKGKDIPSLAEYIKSDECKNVILLVRWFASLQAQWSLKPFWFSWALVGLSCTNAQGRYWSCFLRSLLALRSQYVCWHSWFQVTRDWYALRPTYYIYSENLIIMRHIYRTIRMLQLFSFNIYLADLESLVFGQSNLARLNLPHPEAVFEIGFFRRNPVPCTSYIFWPGTTTCFLTHYNHQKSILWLTSYTLENFDQQ